LQESRTKTTSFMVMLVSAMFVDKMTCDMIEKNCLKKINTPIPILNNKTCTDLSHTIRDRLEHSSLFFPGDLRVKGQDSVLMTALEGHNIEGIAISHFKKLGDTSQIIRRKDFT